jgi:hypothetical protein
MRLSSVPASDALISAQAPGIGGKTLSRSSAHCDKTARSLSFIS